MVTLDILIPHFNDPEGLGLSLQSVAEQTWQGEMRVIVVDDGSTDENFAAVERIVAASGLTITLHRNTRNLGRPRTRNRLLDLAAAPYLAWLDADDVWYPDKIETQFALLDRLVAQGEDPAKLWITCDYDWQWEGQNARLVEQDVTDDQFRSLFLGDRLRAYLWTLLGTAESFHRVGGFDEELPRLQDLDFFLRFIETGGRIFSTGESIPHCRYNKSDLGRSATEIWACNQRIMDKNRHHLERFDPATIRRIRYKAYRLSARYALNNKEYLSWAKYMAAGLGGDPRYAAYRIRRRILGR